MNQLVLTELQVILIPSNAVQAVDVPDINGSEVIIVSDDSTVPTAATMNPILNRDDNFFFNFLYSIFQI